MRIVETSLPGVLIVKPKFVGDARGFFMEAFQARRYAEGGIVGPFVQDNVSFSRFGVLRGLHFQHPHAQGKLVYVLQGEIFDVAVDIRQGSPAFGKWFAASLSADNKRQLWVPAGFAHGFCVTSETALFAYKCTDYYQPEAEGTVAWNDPRVGVDWPLKRPELSAKDDSASPLDQIPPSGLPMYSA
ncbi:MAG: dTDP-4-dehydrorhamnose 3,5-epimerase [Gammaproteobacteria bacterium]